MLRLIKTKNNGFILTNMCGLITENGTPMVGLRYCKEIYPHFVNVTKILFWKFIKCKR